MLGNLDRWRSRAKPGQAVVCRVVARVAGGYSVAFGDRLTGFLPTESDLSTGQELILQFVGYRNQKAIFNAGFGVGPQCLRSGTAASQA